MAPPSFRPVNPEGGRGRQRQDTRSKANNSSKVKKPARELPPGLREEEDDPNWPPKYNKAPRPDKPSKKPLYHPRTGRKQSDTTPTPPRPRVPLRISPERAFDMYDEGWRNTTEGDPEVYERRMRMFYNQVCADPS